MELNNIEKSNKPAKVLVMRALFCAVLLLMTPGITIAADNRHAAEALLKDKLDSVILILQSKNLDIQGKRNEINNIVTPMFDFSLMAKLTLGRKYWPGLTKEQKGRFTVLFIDLLKDTCLEKISLYTNEKVVYQGTVKIKNKVHVETDLISGNSTISMLFKFFKSSNGWKVYDLEIEGVSLINTYRSQFDEVLRKGTIDDLLLKLEKPEKT